jgi:PIN domain nuclease of toxin-antitoxin system
LSREREQDPEEAARNLTDAGILGQGLTLRSFDDAQALEVARLRLHTRDAGLSLGDRACLALAASPGLPALTVGCAWLGPGPGIEVRLIR